MTIAKGIARKFKGRLAFEVDALGAAVVPLVPLVLLAPPGDPAEPAAPGGGAGGLYAGQSVEGTPAAPVMITDLVESQADV